MPHNHQHPPLGPELAGEMGATLAAFNTAVFAGPGEIPRKYRELIAIAVALTTQCESCIRFHTEDAVSLGASTEEIAELTYIAAAMRSGGAIVHGMKALSVAARTAQSSAATQHPRALNNQATSVPSAIPMSIAASRRCEQSPSYAVS